MNVLIFLPIHLTSIYNFRPDTGFFQGRGDMTLPKLLRLLNVLLKSSPRGNVIIKEVFFRGFFIGYWKSAILFTLSIVYSNRQWNCIQLLFWEFKNSIFSRKVAVNNYRLSLSLSPNDSKLYKHFSNTLFLSPSLFLKYIQTLSKTFKN